MPGSCEHWYLQILISKESIQSDHITEAVQLQLEVGCQTQNIQTGFNESITCI